MSQVSNTDPFDLDALLEPVDREHLRRMAALTPGQRMLAMAEVSAFQRGLLRGAFRPRCPDLPIEEVNMLTRYYADPQQMRDSIRLGIMFNIITRNGGRPLRPAGYRVLAAHSVRSDT